LSGGGAVYHDLGNLNFSLLCRSEYAEQMPYQDVIIKALKEFDLQAEFNGRNDLVIQDRKFSGNAFYDDGEVYCQHGTILICADIERMTYYLTPEVSKLERNHVQSVASRVIDLSELSDAVTVESMKKAVIRAVGGMPLEIDVDGAAVKEKEDFFAGKEWIYGGER
jgi:lipoate-protein ligase A